MFSSKINRSFFLLRHIIKTKHDAQIELFGSRRIPMLNTAIRHWLYTLKNSDTDLRTKPEIDQNTEVKTD